MQCACAIFSSVACPTLQHFSTLSCKRRDFLKQLLKEKSVFPDFLQLLFEIYIYFFILSRFERDMIVRVYWSSCKLPLILVRVQRHLNVPDRFSKITRIPNFMKIRPVGDELFRADGRTDMTKLIVAFRNLSKVPKTV
jgi:hypothetical protein